MTTSLKLILAISLLINLPVKASLHYQKQDLNDWKKIDLKSWFSFHEWRKTFHERAEDIYFKTKFIASSKKERLGFVISCVGLCELFRGEKKNYAHKLTEIKEGDEIITQKNSYLYLFILDGTLVRLAPNTSLSLNDIDISPTRFFIHARLNNGFMQWIARSEDNIPQDSLHDTDQLFSKTIPIIKNRQSFYDPDSQLRNRIDELNRRVDENNEFTHFKKTTVLIRTPVANIMGKNGNFSIFSILGYETFIKSDIETKLTLRKRKSPPKINLEKNEWYKVDRYGKKVKKNSSLNATFGMAELMTKRPFTMFLKREKWLKKYSQELFDPTTPLERIYHLGYQMWDYKDYDILKIKFFDLDKKIKRIQRISNYFEKRNLYSALYLTKKNKIDRIPFGPSFYRLALESYLDYIAQRKNH